MRRWFGTCTGRRRRSASGFTLLEVVFAMGLLGFALLGLFALHNVAIGSNRQAGRLSTCTMLAQQEMEYLMGLPWKNGSSLPSDLALTASDPTTKGNPYAYFAHPSGTAGTAPNPINASGTTSASDGPLMYYRTWDVSEPFSGDDTIIEIKVRVIFFDKSTRKSHGVTISSFRYQDPA
jgi:Tfp pilus assembly protein PilV